VKWVGLKAIELFQTQIHLKKYVPLLLLLKPEYTPTTCLKTEMIQVGIFLIEYWEAKKDINIMEETEEHQYFQELRKLAIDKNIDLFACDLIVLII